MARPRSSARMAPKHTGDLYNRGYQHEAEQQFTVVLGPWDRISDWSVAYADLVPPEDLSRTIFKGNNIYIDRGIVYGFAEKSSKTGISDAYALGANDVVLNGTEYLVIIYRDLDNADVITIHTDDGTTTDTDASAETSTGERVECEAWGDDLYLVSLDLDNVYKYTKSTGVFAAVANSPTYGEFIFTLDNNICVIKFNTTDDVWEVYWSVDSDPTDWTSSGSGNNTIPGRYGDVKGVGFFGGSAIILCTFGAYRMTPTGSSEPAFSFSDVPEIDGAGVKYGVASGAGKIFYGDRRNITTAYDGRQPIRLGPVDSDCYRMSYSKIYNRLLLKSRVDYQIELYDPNTLMWVGCTYAEEGEFFLDGPGDYIYNIDTDTDNDDIEIWRFGDRSSFANGNFYTPHIEFGVDVEIQSIDIYKTTPAEYLKFDESHSLALSYWTASNTDDDYVKWGDGNTVSLDGVTRLHTNIVGRRFKLSLVGKDDSSNQFTNWTGIRSIVFNCRLVSDESKERIVLGQV